MLTVILTRARTLCLANLCAVCPSSFCNHIPVSLSLTDKCVQMPLLQCRVTLRPLCGTRFAPHVYIWLTIVASLLAHGLGILVFWRDSRTCVMWLTCCQNLANYMWHGQYTRVIRLINLSDMTHSYVMWPILMGAVTYAYSHSTTWPIHGWDTHYHWAPQTNKKSVFARSNRMMVCGVCQWAKTPCCRVLRTRGHAKVTAEVRRYSNRVLRVRVRSLLFQPLNTSKLSHSLRNDKWDRVVPGHKTHFFDAASEFLSTNWWSQNPACQRCVYKPLKNCHPASEFLYSP